MSRYSYLSIIFILQIVFLFPANAQRPVLDENGNETGLINMNPDPDGEPWIAGGLGPMTEEERVAFDNIPTFTLPAHLKGRQLPPTCDHSTEPEFRPIFNQIGGSCGQASGMGYHFTFERNQALGTTAAETKNRCAYGITWNFLNGGSGSGSFPHSGYYIAQVIGCGHVPDFNNADNGGSQTAWMDGYAGYHNGNDCHVTEIVKFQASDIAGMKNWFYDKATGTGKNGGCVTFCSNCNYPTTTIASGPYKGEKLCTSLTDGNAHAQTFSGYSDEISYDVNGDGRITNDVDITRDGVVDYNDYETGAIQLVNSWGSTWMNKGKLWVRYGGIKCNTIIGIRVAKHVPKMECKIKISHSSRSSIRITTGVSNDISATDPKDTMMYAKAFNYAGGSYPMEGSGGSNEIEIGLDATKLYNKITGTQAKIFLVVDSKGGTGKVTSFSVLDYAHGEPPVEYTCTQQNVAINTGKTTLFVVISGTPVTKTVTPEIAHDIRFFNKRVYFTIPRKPGADKVTIKLYSMQGKLLRTVMSEKLMSSGDHSISLQPQSDAGMADGNYLCSVKIGDFVKTVGVVMKR